MGTAVFCPRSPPFQKAPAPCGPTRVPHPRDREQPHAPMLRGVVGVSSLARSSQPYTLWTSAPSVLNGQICGSVPRGFGCERHAEPATRSGSDARPASIGLAKVLRIAASEIDPGDV